MTTDLNKIRRYERKYLVTHAQAQAIREFIRPFFRPDQHTDATLGGYLVNNIYLDTPELRFYQDVKLRRTRRFKPRMRYYGTSPDGWLWLEVKNKDSDIVWKHRQRVPHTDWPKVLLPRPVDVLDRRIHSVQGPSTFVDLVGLFDVQPVLHVRYFREAWVSLHDEYGRVTFDTRLRCCPAHGSTQLVMPDEAMEFYDDPVTTGNEGSWVLLEVKTETLVPWWAIQLTRAMQLWQRGFSKYCYGIDRMREAEEMGAPRRPAYL
jgi:hypothetical protein